VKYLYDDGEHGTGDLKFERRGARKGLPVLRPPGTRTPCHVCAKVPDRLDGKVKRREDAADLNERHRVAFRHYLRCKAVGRFPEDEIVERNAALFAEAESLSETTWRVDDRKALFTLIEALRGG
jgi:hypothetical protein